MSEEDTFKALRRVPFDRLTMLEGEHFDVGLERQGWSFEEWFEVARIKQTERLLANVN